MKIRVTVIILSWLKACHFSSINCPINMIKVLYYNNRAASALKDSYFRRNFQRYLCSGLRSLLYKYVSIMSENEKCLHLMLGFQVFLGCGQATSENCTYLTQASTTAPVTPSCNYKICKCSANICRIRLDFEVRPVITVNC